MKSIDKICGAGKRVGKRWMQRHLSSAVAASTERLACHFEAGKKVAIKLNILSYANS